MMNKLLAPVVTITIAVATCAGMVGVFNAGMASAQPAPSDAGVAVVTNDLLVEGTLGSAAAPVVAPADKIAKDPIANPTQAFDDIKAAKKTGWGIFVLTIALVLCRVLARLGGVFKRLREGKVALAVAAFTALTMTAFNAIALGGSWVAALAAGVTAAFAAWDAKSPTTADQTTTTPSS
jgi:hypothetical protein